MRFKELYEKSIQCGSSSRLANRGTRTCGCDQRGNEA